MTAASRITTLFLAPCAISPNKALPAMKWRRRLVSKGGRSGATARPCTMLAMPKPCSTMVGKIAWNTKFGGRCWRTTKWPIRSVGAVVEKINHNKDYDGLFEKAFGRPAGIETIGMAIASYERALISANSPFDRWYFGKQEQAMPPQAQRGFKLFVGKAECSQCHIISKDYAFFSDNGFHNTGIGYQGSMLNKSQKQTRPVQIAPGVFADVPNAIIQSLSESKANDLGHYEISQNPKDRWSYKTPSLRNVALTQPYMHDGSLASLEDVVAFYNQGGIVNENLDSLLKPLHLSPQESEALVAFLQSLTGDNVESLVSDAFAAPIGDKE